MVSGLKNAVLDWLNKAPPALLLSIPFLICGTVVILVLATNPFAGTMRYVFFAALFGATLFSRMLQTFEWGVEIFHFTTFCFTLVYGLVPGLIFTLAGSILVLYAAVFIGGHMFNHSVPGPLIQCVELFIMTILAGIAGALFRDFAIHNLVTVAMAIYIPGIIVEKLLLNRIIGIDWWRSGNAAMIGILLNYNIFSTFGVQLIALLQKFA